MRRVGIAWLVVAAALAPAAARASTVPVNLEFQAFTPQAVDALPGDTVQWTNGSVRRHTVTADDGSFDSGDLFQDGVFSRQFDAVGTYTYHCTVHLGMTGEVDVRDVTLDPLPAVPVPFGRPVTLTGRTATPSLPVTIEVQTPVGFRPVATAIPAPDGTWSTPVPVRGVADYRAVVGADATDTRHLLVTTRRVEIHATRGGVAVTVTPPDPDAEIVLQLRLRDRFGWWPEARARLDYLSRASFRVRGPVRARVALVDRDRWTALATSPVVRVAKRRAR